MPHVRNWIYAHGDEWLDKLISEFKVDANTAGPLVSLKYNQIESPMFNPLVQECRGMVVDCDTKRILCHPYNKFWNLGESLAAPIDWSTARVQDKLDGSLALLYDREGIWNFASSGTPHAGGRYGKEEITFADKFWRTFYANAMILPRPDLAEWGFFFELVAPDNRIVVKYDEPRLILHGSRNRETEEEMPRAQLEAIAAEHNWPIVREHPLRTKDEVDEAIAELDPVEGEGFIVVDGQHNRVKIKSPRYVALHQLRDRTTTSAIITLWKQGEIGELLTYFPEYERDVTAVTDKLEAGCVAAFDAYLSAKDAPSRKDYAQAVKGHAWTSIAFKLLDNQATSVDDARAILRAGFDTLAEKIIEAA